MEQGFGPDQLISCYRRGIFPMSDDRDDDTLFLVDPKARGIIPLDDLHVSRSMQKFRRKTPFHVTFNRAFPEVISACCLLYTSPSPRDRTRSRMPSSA